MTHSMVRTSSAPIARYASESGTPAAGPKSLSAMPMNTLKSGGWMCRLSAARRRSSRRITGSRNCQKSFRPMASKRHPDDPRLEPARYQDRGQGNVGPLGSSPALSGGPDHSGIGTVARPPVKKYRPRRARRGAAAARDPAVGTGTGRPRGRSRSGRALARGGSNDVGDRHLCGAGRWWLWRVGVHWWSWRCTRRRAVRREGDGWSSYHHRSRSRRAGRDPG